MLASVLLDVEAVCVKDLRWVREPLLPSVRRRAFVESGAASTEASEEWHCEVLVRRTSQLGGVRRILCVACASSVSAAGQAGYQ